MFQTRKPNGALWHLAGLAVGCLAVVAAFFAAGERELGFFFSSDSLYLPSIYRDIFQEGGHLRQWSLNAAPNFFPDMGIFFMTEGLTESFLSATYIFPMVQFIGFFFFFHVALRLGTGLRDGRPATFAAMMVAMVFLWSIHGWDFYLAFLLLMNSWHLGALLNALMALCLLLWAIRRTGWLPFSLLVVLTVLGSASDRSFWTLFSAPACAVLVFAAFRSMHRKRLLLLASLIAAGSAVGYILLGILGFMIESPYQVMAFQRIAMSWERFSEQFFRLFIGNELKVYLMYVALFSLLYAIWKALREIWKSFGRDPAWRDRDGDARLVFYLFLPLACLANLISPVLNGSYDGDDSLRYNFAAIILALLSSSLIIADLGKRDRTIATALVLAFVLSASLWIIVPSEGRMEALLNYQPERSRLMDELAKDEGLRYGAAEYWDAKLMTMFSREGLEIAPVGEDQTLYVHVIRPGSQYAPDQNNARTFVVLSRPEKNGISKVKFGEQRSVERGGVQVVITEPWVFDPVTLQPVPVAR